MSKILANLCSTLKKEAFFLVDDKATKKSLFFFKPHPQISA